MSPRKKPPAGRAPVDEPLPAAPTPSSVDDELFGPRGAPAAVKTRRGLHGWFLVVVWGATWIVASLVSMLFIELVSDYLAGGSEYD